MIKLVFLVGETKEMINEWPGLTARITRAVKEEMIINGIKMREALIYDGKKIKNFYFIPIENPELIPVIMEKINNFPQKKLKRMFAIENEKRIIRIFKIEVAIVVARLNPFLPILVGEKRSMYHCNLSYGWVFFLNGFMKEAINQKIINEFTACFFRDDKLDNKLALAHSKATKESSKWKNKKEFPDHFLKTKKSLS